MKAKETNFLDFLSVRKQLVIPIYQRTYSWTKGQCKQLWDDICRVVQYPEISAHFIGSVVYIEEGIYHVSSTAQLLVIDGQQRLTTLSLLLLALSREIAKTNDDPDNSSHAISEYYLFNHLMRGDLRYKLMLTQSDKETYINLLENREPPKSASHRILENYQFFEDAVQKCDLDYERILHGINKLVVVDVSLDRNYDNPQLIFESLNSTGLDLTQADLIRNYILMGLEAADQEELYTRYWYPMEERFGHAEYAELFDRFMRDYLTIKSETGKIPNIRDVYSDFKTFIHKRDIHAVVRDISLFSSFFTRLAFPDRNDDIEIRRVLEGINTLKVDVAYPLLLEVFDDYERHQLISRPEFIEILKLVESYVFRRAIVGIPTNSMNKTFATFKRFIIDKNNYLSSVKYIFITLEGYRRFPRDTEFWDIFVLKDIYNLRQRRTYLFTKLENYDRKEYVNIDEYTIEHIMPQNPNLSIEWQRDLGDNWESIHDKYLHTIGNLTLTGYNPELSDRPFMEKRTMKGGFADSPLRLNRDLGKLQKWSDKEISDRAEILADLALEIWNFPSISQETIDRFRELASEDSSQYSIEQFEHLEGENLSIFTELRRRILNLDSSVREEYKKHYIAYKTTTNFVDIRPMKSELLVWINMEFDEVGDEKMWCRDVSEIGHYGNGDVEFRISSFSDINYCIYLVKQSFEKHTDYIAI
jgi:uncharacterized protein with ParB-like and HNH nuclease domain/predicted transport protein